MATTDAIIRAIIIINPKFKLKVINLIKLYNPKAKFSIPLVLHLIS